MRLSGVCVSFLYPLILMHHQRPQVIRGFARHISFARQFLRLPGIINGLS